MQHPHHRHGGGYGALAGAFEHVAEELQGRRRKCRTVHLAFWNEPAERLPSLDQVVALGAVGLWPVERRAVDVVLGHDDAKPVRQPAALVGGEEFLLMHRVAAFDAGPQAISLHGLQQQHARFAGDLLGLAEGGVDLLVVVAATADGADLLVGEGAHQPLEGWIVLHPMLAHEVAGRDGVHLVVRRPPPAPSALRGCRPRRVRAAHPSRRPRSP